ncbi:MAG: polyphosphate:AMP phosphotransferase [Lachnospiraceae bacterium]
MLEKIDLEKKIGKKEYKANMEQLQPKLAYLQRAAKELGIPVMIVVEGLDTAGKGTLIRKIIEPLDPRGFTVYTNGTETDEERMHPFFWRYMSKTPEKGRISIFDCGWYRWVLRDRFRENPKEEVVRRRIEQICSFEQMMAEDGCLIIKLFAHITKKEQKKRQEKLLQSKKTSWRVSKEDLARNKEYDRYLELNEEVIEQTESEYASWKIVESMDAEYAAVKAMQIIVTAMEEAIAKKKAQNEKQDKKEEICVQSEMEPYATSILQGVDLNCALTKEEYKEKLEKLQKRLGELHNEIYGARIPVVLAFEGWDAGGKGGAIKRLTQALDPRGYVVNPISAPNDSERAHQYLWRFWTRFPKDGHIAIFDRSWYGRVMVERIEGFCTEAEWKRAYREINQMERQLTEFGTVVLKFWMQIDKDEQQRRFQERQENPAKQWKITDEDWRNRAKWDAYEKAVDEMLLKTSTEQAPWIVVEGNNKYFARIKVLETVISALEEKLREKKN